MRAGKGGKRPTYGQRVPRVMDTGYVRIYRPDHVLAKADGYVLEHRLVMYEAGVELQPGEHVHHINGDPADNRLENLEVMQQNDHIRRHADTNGSVHGTYGGYTKHAARRGGWTMPACDACMEAARAYYRARPPRKR